MRKEKGERRKEKEERKKKEERRKEKGERRKEKGERRKEKGERRKEKGERRKEKGKRKKKAGYSEKAVVDSLCQSVSSCQRLRLVQRHVVVRSALSSVLRLHDANFERVLQEVRGDSEEICDEIERRVVGNR
jgi:hypothetical protein